MADILLMVLEIALTVFWLKALINYDGSKPDFCEDCDPELCPFPCEKNMH